MDADAPQSVASLAVGSRFRGRYEITRTIKSGGMGAVYEVVDVETKRRRALKVMHPGLVEDQKLWERFKLEATITATVRSEHIVDVLDAGVDGETSLPFLVMELLEGRDLSTRLRIGRPLPVDEALVLLRQAATALDKTHAAGIVHRDLKPANLFLAQREDGSPRLVIVDFGIARTVSLTSGTLEHTTGIGTPLYMAPEQIRGGRAIGPTADLFSLALIAYSALVGRAYWRRDQMAASSDFQLTLTIAEGPKEPATARAAEVGVTLPSGFDAWFARATAIVPEDRFPTASAMVEALARALAGGEVSQGAVSSDGVSSPSGGLHPEAPAHTPSSVSKGAKRSAEALPEPPASAPSMTGAPLSRQVAAEPPRRRLVIPLATFGLGLAATALALALGSPRAGGVTAATTPAASATSDAVPVAKELAAPAIRDAAAVVSAAPAGAGSVPAPLEPPPAAKAKPSALPPPPPIRRPRGGAPAGAAPAAAPTAEPARGPSALPSVPD